MTHIQSHEHDVLATRGDNANSAASAEQRVSVLVGDRLCIKCGYNLVGQSVVREPHYQMLIVRCPECGTVASLQEYPLLGHWANRWAALLAAMWFALMMLIVLGGGAAIFGFSFNAAWDASATFNTYVALRYQKHFEELARAQGQTTPNFSYTEMTKWYQEQDFDAMFREAGGWATGVNWSALFLWAPGSICIFAIGCMVAVASLRANRTKYVVAGMIMAAAFMYCYLFAYLPWQNQQAYWYWNDSITRIGTPMLGLSLVIGAVALGLGVLLGRKVVRGLLRILLPPRLLQSLATLWIIDGLQPPRESRK